MKYLVLDPKNTFQNITGLFNEEVGQFEFDGQIHYKKGAEFFRQYDAVLCIHTVEPLNSYILNKCNLFSVKTIVVFDGIYEWENAYNNPKHISAGMKLYDPIDAAMALTVGAGNNYLSYINANVKFYSYRPSRMKIELANGAESKVGTVLLTTAKTPYFSLDERTRLVCLYKEVLNKCLAMFEVVDFRFFDEELLNDIGGDISRNKVRGAFIDVVKNYGALITTPSTISIEAMSLGLPVAHLDYRDSPLFCQAGWRINQSIDIADVLESMKKLDSGRLNFQFSEVESTLNPDLSIERSLSDLVGLNGRMPSVADRFYESESRLMDSRWNLNFKAIGKSLIKKVGFR
ncbi:MAG: hypothetical protein RPS47_16975 [Colwellia sp.]|jgi:hypothetical protein